MQSTQAIKKAKITPDAKPLKVEKQEKKPADPNDVKPMKSLNEKVVDHINKIVAKLENDLVEASATYVEVSAEENKEHVPANLVKKMGSAIVGIQNRIATGKKWAEEKSADKEGFKTFFSAATEEVQSLKTISSTINTCLDSKSE